jgi:hypothetical protein
MEFYRVGGAWMTTCYPENLFLAQSDERQEQLFNILKLIKDL